MPINPFPPPGESTSGPGPIKTSFELVRASKAVIMAAVANLYPDELGGKTIKDLERYGDDPFDSSYILFEFFEVNTGPNKGVVDHVRFVKGSIIALMSQIDPTNFGDKTAANLVSYADDEVDPTLVKFIFRM